MFRSHRFRFLLSLSLSLPQSVFHFMSLLSFAHFSWLWLLLLLFDCALVDVLIFPHLFSDFLFSLCVRVCVCVLWLVCMWLWVCVDIFSLFAVCLCRIIIICIFICASRSQRCIECELSTFYACEPLTLLLILHFCSLYKMNEMLPLQNVYFHTKFFVLHRAHTHTHQQSFTVSFLIGIYIYILYFLPAQVFCCLQFFYSVCIDVDVL